MSVDRSVNPSHPPCHCAVPSMVDTPMPNVHASAILKAFAEFSKHDRPTAQHVTATTTEGSAA
jgi:hypothetical protein